MPSPAADILKNFNLFIDGFGFAGNCEEVQLPALTILTEDFRAGGLDAPIGIDMGMEKMVASFKITNNDADAMGWFGGGPQDLIPLEFRGALEDLDGNVSQLSIVMRGTVRELASDAWQAGQKAPKTFSVDLQYYRYDQDGDTIHEIDVLNMVRIVNGQDRLVDIRNAIGI